MRAFLPAILIVGATALAPGAAHAAGDAEKGKKVFNRCKACHMVGPKARNRVGPALNGLIGRPAGGLEGYRYSKLHKAAGEKGLVWNDETLVPYLKDPTKYLKEYLKGAGSEDLAKGRSKMTFKLKKEQDAQNVIEYLKQFPQSQ